MAEILLGSTTCIHILQNSKPSFYLFSFLFTFSLIIIIFPTNPQLLSCTWNHYIYLDLTFQTYQSEFIVIKVVRHWEKTFYSHLYLFDFFFHFLSINFFKLSAFQLLFFIWSCFFNVFMACIFFSFLNSLRNFECVSDDYTFISRQNEFLNIYSFIFFLLCFWRKN